MEPRPGLTEGVALFGLDRRVEPTTADELVARGEQGETGTKDVGERPPARRRVEVGYLGQEDAENRMRALQARPRRSLVARVVETALQERTVQAKQLSSQRDEDETGRTRFMSELMRCWTWMPGRACNAGSR